MNAFGNPFMLWSKVALTATEMMMASASVIGQRTTRMAIAGANPTASDLREHTLMSQEKVEAVTQSAQQVWARTLKINQQFATLAFKEMLAAMTAAMSLGTRRVGVDTMTEQVKIVQDAVNNTAVAASRMSGAAAQLTQRALAPVRSRATRNAKRLSKRKR